MFISSLFRHTNDDGTSGKSDAPARSFSWDLRGTGGPNPLTCSAGEDALASLNSLAALTLAGVALGSIPALALASLATNFAARAEPSAWRTVITRAAGALLIVMAAVTLSRAIPGGHGSHASQTPAATAPADHSGHH